MSTSLDEKSDLLIQQSIESVENNLSAAYHLMGKSNSRDEQRKIKEHIGFLETILDDLIKQPHNFSLADIGTLNRYIQSNKKPMATKAAGFKRRRTRKRRTRS